MPVKPCFSLKGNITLNESDNQGKVPAILLFHKKMNFQMKSNEDMILALAGQFKQLSHEPEKFR